MGAADIREMLGTDLIELPEETDKKKKDQKKVDTGNAAASSDAATAAAPAALSEEEVKRAMASAEDDADAVAASAAEKELAEENAADFEEAGAEGGEGGVDGQAVLKATATDAHSMLKPIEKYAVRVWLRVTDISRAHVGHIIHSHYIRSIEQCVLN